jgi:hypothetical protein
VAKRIPLLRRDGTVAAHALIDDIDAEDVGAHRWFHDPAKGWARRREKQADGKWPLIDMHRFVLGIVRGRRVQIIHANGDGLDNRRTNLRIVGGVRSAELDGADCRIPLFARDGSVRAWTVIDAEDFAVVQAYSWSLSASGYAVAHVPGSGNRGPTARMHRLILALVGGDSEVDHKDHDRLNNRKSNLRLADRQMQTQNTLSHRGSTSRFRGVYWHANRWEARVGRVNLGRFTDEVEAGRVAQEYRRIHMPASIEDPIVAGDDAGTPCHDARPGRD